MMVHYICTQLAHAFKYMIATDPSLGPACGTCAWQCVVVGRYSAELDSRQ